MAELIWHKIMGPDVPFRYESDPTYVHNVQLRIPSVEKARTVLGFELLTSLNETLDTVIPWIEETVKDGLI